MTFAYKSTQTQMHALIQKQMHSFTQKQVHTLVQTLILTYLETKLICLHTAVYIFLWLSEWKDVDLHITITRFKMIIDKLCL